MPVSKDQRIRWLLRMVERSGLSDPNDIRRYMAAQTTDANLIDEAMRQINGVEYAHFDEKSIKTSEKAT